jgi:hypothetical protein
MSQSLTEVQGAAEPPATLLAAILQLARDPSVDVNKLRELLAMQERLEARQAEAAFNTALHAAQTDMPRVPKNGRVRLGDGKGGYDFATWEDMDTALRPIMQRHGFSLSFDTTQRDGGGMVVTGRLLHVNGHSKTASMPLALDTGAGRNNLQAGGSSLSYGKRYVAEMLFNIVRIGSDDDGRIGGTKYVSETEALEIESLIRETNSDRARFMQTFEIADMLHLPEASFIVAKNMLLQKKGKR